MPAPYFEVSSGPLHSEKRGADSLADWSVQNLINPALNAGPLAIYNAATTCANLPECHLDVGKAAPYDFNWFAQGLASGTGASLPFLLSKGLSARIFGITGRTSSIVGATLWGAAEKPDSEHTRLGNALGMGVGFGAFEGGSALKKALPEWSKIFAYPAAGFLGGAAMSEASSLGSHARLAPLENVFQSGIQGLALNSIAIPFREVDPKKQSLHFSQWPDPLVTASEVRKSVSNMPIAGASGDLVLGEWNMEFLNTQKANYFADTYKAIVPKHHLLFIEEANENGLSKVALANNYNYAISSENSYGQAVGFLINPRLKVLNTHQYNEVRDVFNVSDLRPAYRVDLLDTTTNKNLSAVVVHFKSMNGNEGSSSAIRKEQAKRLVKALGPEFEGIAGGDWNTFLDTTREFDVLKNAGFEIVDPNSCASTQEMGGRLDGFFVKGLAGTMSPAEVRPFFANKNIGRGLSDHGLLTSTYSAPSDTTSRYGLDAKLG